MRAAPGLRRGLGRGVVRERPVAKDESDVFAVGLLNLFEGRTDPRAVRSLKVGVLHDRDLGVGRAHRHLVGRDDDLDPRRFQIHGHGGSLLQAVQHRLHRRALLLPLEVLTDLRSGLLQRLTTGSARVLVVEGLYVGVGDRRNLVQDFLLDQLLNGESSYSSK